MSKMYSFEELTDSVELLEKNHQNSYYYHFWFFLYFLLDLVFGRYLVKLIL